MSPGDVYNERAYPHCRERPPQIPRQRALPVAAAVLRQRDTARLLERVGVLAIGLSVAVHCALLSIQSLTYGYLRWLRRVSYFSKLNSARIERTRRPR